MNLLAIAILFPILSMAQTRNFPTCSANVVREELDGMCPRLEGIHLPVVAHRSLNSLRSLAVHDF